MGAVYMGRIGLADDGVALFMSAAILGGAHAAMAAGRIFRTAATDASRWPWWHSPRRWRGLPPGGVPFAGYWRSARSRSTAGWLSRIYRSRSPAGRSSGGRRSGHRLSGLLLVHGVGAVVSPLVAGLMMDWIGPQALPLHFAAMQLLLALAAFASLRRSEPRFPEPGHFMPMLRTSTTVLEMMPANAPPPSDAPAGKRRLKESLSSTAVDVQNQKRKQENAHADCNRS